MAYTTINKSTEHFNTKLYSGNSSTQSISSVGFQPDMTWIKRRGSAEDHALFDAVRGATKRLFPSRDYSEATQTGGLTSFDSDGFSLGNGDAVNGSDTYASWNWKANGAGSANTTGSINSTVSVNTTAGFSIVSFVGNATSGATVGHGLSAVPKVVIIKGRDSALEWRSYFSPIGAGKYMVLNENHAEATGSNFMNNTAPTNQVFYLGNGTTPNKNGENYIAYCFAEKTGYSKFGSYTGNGNADGPMIYTGFKPAFVIIKKTDGADNWTINDNKRVGYNADNNELFANLSNAEDTNDVLDLVSNGFKLRHTAGRHNTSGGSYIYMAFGQSIVGSNNIPATAR